MPNKSKAKGNRFEREIVDAVELHEVKCVRAWGSNGRALGHHEEVDILIDDDIKVQAKVRKALPKWIKPNENVDIQAIIEESVENSPSRNIAEKTLEEINNL